jgi:hypothetical protein
MKKVIFNKRQITEVLGIDFSYLDNENPNYFEYGGDREISTGEKMYSNQDAEPVTTDKIAKSIAPRYPFGFRNIRSTLACSVDNIKSLVESNKDLEGKKFRIPDNVYNNLKNNLNQYNDQKNQKGYKRLTNLVNNRDISTTEMYRLKNFFENSEKNSFEYKLIGGDLLRNWVEKELKTATSISRNTKENQRNMGVDNAFIKPHNKDSNNGQGHSSELEKTKKNFGITFSYES